MPPCILCLFDDLSEVAQSPRFSHSLSLLKSFQTTNFAVIWRFIFLTKPLLFSSQAYTSICWKLNIACQFRDGFLYMMRLWVSEDLEDYAIILAGAHADPCTTRRCAGRVRHYGCRSPKFIIHLPSMLCSIPDINRQYRRMHPILEVSYHLWDRWHTRNGDASLWMDGMGYDDSERWCQWNLCARYVLHFGIDADIFLIWWSNWWL